MKKISWKTVVLHVVLILIFQSIPILSSPDFELSTRMFEVKPFLQNFLGYSFVIFFFYLHTYVLLPRFVLKRKYWIYGMLVVLYFVSMTVLVKVVIQDNMPFPRPQQMEFNGMNPGPPMNNGVFGWFQLFGLLAPFLLVTLFSYAIHLSRKARQMELDRIEAELKQLKYQLQPHFLFNSLNNIYSISILTPEKTPEYILELSEIIRYLLQTEHESEVNLKHDLRFCQQYVDLQKLRFGKNADNWDIKWPELDSICTLKIPPFLIIPLIENVFKYGIHPEKTSPIKIQVEVKQDQLILITENNKNNLSNDNLLSSQKLGLKKTQQRIQLLYPGKHLFEIEEDEFTYKLCLKLKLN